MGHSWGGTPGACVGDVRAHGHPRQRDLAGIAEAGIPILLLLASEPKETREQNEQAVPACRERFPDAEIHFLENSGHDLFADAGPELGRLVADWASRVRPTDSPLGPPASSPIPS